MFAMTAKPRLFGLAALGALSLCALAAAPGVNASPVRDAGSSPTVMAVPFDRQDYVTVATTHNPQDNSVVDPYDGDPSSVHVAINGGKDFAHSYVHLALDYLPDGAVATSATMTMHLTQQNDASNTGDYQIYNVNNTEAIIEACALTTELPAQFDDQHPPAYDCQHGSAVGSQSKSGDIWTFPLKNLVDYWTLHGNTGAALIGIGSGDQSQTWQVAFYRSRSAATVAYTAPPLPTTNPGTTVTGPVPNNAGSGSSVVANSGGSVPPPPGQVVAPAPVTSPAVAPAPATSAAAAPLARQSNSSTPVWPWVLLGCLALAAGAVAAAHWPQIVAAMPKGVTVFRLHPRAYTLASAAMVWGLVFTGYSVVTQPAHNGQTLAGSQQPTGNGGSTGPNGASTTPTSGTTTPGAVAGQPAGSSAPGSTLGPLPHTTGNPSVIAAQTEFNGPGTYKVINGVRVFFPANGGPPVAQLYQGADDVIGITNKQIFLCAHAALTYGSAFNISKSDLDVYWDWVRDHGGIDGRTVTTDYQNDNYDPGTAVKAAQTCKDEGTFFLIGGIGFDQIPAVRQWAEQNHVLYYHHIATIEGSEGLRYSYSPLPTVEQMGTLFGELAVQRYRGQKIGVLYRQSVNWSPGSDAFIRVVKAAGMTVVTHGVALNQGNYTQELTDFNTSGVKVVFAWENALATTEMIKQAESQDYHPAWLVFPFNLEVNTLGSNALDQPILGVAAWDAYDPGYYGGGFTPYASDIKEFEAEYAKYDSSANLSGDGGDLLFLNWEAQRQIGDMLRLCGPGCTRNKIAGILLAGYDRTVPPNCNIDFARNGDHHHGGYLANVLEVQKDPNGRTNFVPTARCVSSIGG
jgi:ABC-type branched-subunit amino acid transport system substrate-binding protein